MHKVFDLSGHFKILPNVSFKFALRLIHSMLSLIFIVSLRFDARFSNVRVLVLHAVPAVL